MILIEQAESCRKQASEFAGRPEAPFLLRVASAFEELATEKTSHLHVEPNRMNGASRSVSA